MGMFDYVNFKMACPTCGAEMAAFQSKSGECSMDVIEPDSVSNFYDWCEQCKTGVEFHLPRKPLQPNRSTPLTEAEMIALGYVRAVEPRKP